MSESVLRRQLAELGLTEDAPPDAAAWQHFLRTVLRTYRDAQPQRMEALSRLASGIAHDFNNLLSVILGDAEFALESLPKDDPVRADVEEIEAAGRRAALLTQQLVTFGRRQPCCPQIVELDSTIADKRQTIGRVLGENIEIVMNLSSTPGSVEIDPAHVEQALLNLAIHARDAMPDGGTLRIETHDIELAGADAIDLGVTPGGYLVLTVEDDGAGMDETAQAHVFEPFFTTKGIGKGTGLGLATVFGIVKQAGGGIRVRSRPGAGSAFSVYLPRVDDR